MPQGHDIFDGILRASPSTVKRREPSKTWMDDGPVRVMFLVPSSAMPSVPIQCWPDPTDNAGDGRIRKPPRRTVPRSARQTKGLAEESETFFAVLNPLLLFFTETALGVSQPVQRGD